MANLKGWEILILVALVLLLFGSKKLPDAARGIGRSLRIFKSETQGLIDDGKKAEVESTADGQNADGVAPTALAADTAAAPEDALTATPNTPPAAAPDAPAPSAALPANPPAAPMSASSRGTTGGAGSQPGAAS